MFLHLWICTLEDNEYNTGCKSLNDNEVIHVENMNFRVWDVRKNTEIGRNRNIVADQYAHLKLYQHIST